MKKIYTNAPRQFRILAIGLAGSNRGGEEEVPADDVVIEESAEEDAAE